MRERGVSLSTIIGQLKKKMADVARTRAYRTKSCSSNAAVERAVARRQRRNQMRAYLEAKAEGETVLPSEEEDVAAEDRSELPIPESFRHLAHAPPVVEWRSVVPVAGAMAVAGRQRQMEDAVTIWMDLCSPQLNRGLPVHYFGVYDGHGGAHFSMICKQKMHEILKEELVGAADAWGHPPPPPGMLSNESALEETWRVVMNRVFARAEMVALRTCNCGSEGLRCEMSSLAYSGTTAVTVVLTENHFVVSNCGDSRAVLYRSGRIIPLSFDHKPERADEKARIEASGGRVFTTDAPRVEGILAMSRAIGDVFLKPLVVSEPDVTFTRRDEEDEFVIVASDGMWDVVPTHTAGRAASQCLREPPEPDIACRSAAAAALLTCLALSRGSADNISVVVVDLKGEEPALINY